jgi:opacity protein-like surface antigen
MGLRGEDLLLMNAPSGGKALPKTDVHHNKPLSFGLGVSYYLNDRFSLSSGLVYTYLSSEWKTNDEYKVKTTQKLHFIGIPLGLTYKIAKWQRFNLYASAGFQMDVNVVGQQKGELVRDALQTNVIDSEVRSVRDRKLLFSANAKAGVSYPLLRFVSAYAEAGVSYYFNNGGALFDKMSKMPAIYSEKPLNFTLQAGFRLGF